MASKIYKVYLQNWSSINTMCGYGEGLTLEEAQKNALEYCRKSYGVEGVLERGGYQVGFATPVRL